MGNSNQQMVVQRRAQINIISGVLIIFLVLLGVEFYRGAHRSSLSNTVASVDGVSLEVPHYGENDLIAFDIVARGEIKTRYGQSMLETQCKQLDPGLYRCHAAAEYKFTATLTLMPKNEATVVIDDVQFRRLRSVHGTPLGGNVLYVVFLLLLFVPCLWLCYPKKILSQYLTILFSVNVLLWLQPYFTLCLLMFLWVIYKLGISMAGHANVGSTTAQRLRLMTVLVFASLVFLFGFKYGAHALATIFANPGGWSILLPLGLSYFMIRVIDTILRWYRGELSLVSFREFLCFMLFPATIPAGPIDTLNRFQTARLERLTKEDVAYGLGRIFIGLFKKIVLVEFILAAFLFQEGHLFVNVVLAPEWSDKAELLIVPVLFLLFSYLDFSAYSDIAIGLSRLMGYRMVENFNFPILARNIQDYWKRWHMSLSGWCMRNIYFPLVIKTRNTELPFFVTMLVVGLWHAFSLSWFSWAIHHGCALSLFARFQKRHTFDGMASRFLFGILGNIVTLVFVAAGYCFVFVDDFYTAMNLYFLFLVNIIL